MKNLFIILMISGLAIFSSCGGKQIEEVTVEETATEEVVIGEIVTEEVAVEEVAPAASAPATEDAPATEGAIK